MRKVTKQIVAAFLKGEALSVQNTRTDGQTIWLHGNRIAWRDESGSVYATLAGWPTVTTRERLNGLAQELIGERPFYSKRREPFFGAMRIDADQCICLVSQ